VKRVTPHESRPTGRWDCHRHPLTVGKHYRYPPRETDSRPGPSAAFESGSTEALWPPRPDELHGPVSLPAAQAAGNATWTARGCPIGLGINLDVATAGPATEMTLYDPADLAPLHLTPVADAARAPTPEGSRPACAGGDFASPIRPITGWPSLPPSCFARSPGGRSYELPTPRGRATG